MTTRQLPDCGELSSIFSSILRRWLTEKEMARVRLLNSTAEYRERGWCATHNFCDSNVAMLEALAQFGIKEYDASDEMNNLINSAWDMAVKNEFRF